MMMIFLQNVIVLYKQKIKLQDRKIWKFLAGFLVDFPLFLLHNIKKFPKTAFLNLWYLCILHVNLVIIRIKIIIKKPSTYNNPFLGVVYLSNFLFQIF